MTLKKIYVEIAYRMCYIIPTRWMHSLVPIERFMIPVNRTSRESYLKERSIYRLSFALQNEGDALPKRLYFHYKHIAQKYNWCYIKELYDD